MPSRSCCPIPDDRADGGRPRCRQGFCTETDERCSLIEQDERSFQAGSLDCAYFADCVMPADWTLNDLAAYALWYASGAD